MRDVADAHAAAAAGGGHAAGQNPQQRDRGPYSARATSFGGLAVSGVDGQAGLLRLDLVLMVIPGANGRVNKAAKEKQEADEQYDAGHSGVKSMSFAHTRDLTHSVFPG